MSGTPQQQQKASGCIRQQIPHQKEQRYSPMEHEALTVMRRLLRGSELLLLYLFGYKPTSPISPDPKTPYTKTQLD